MSPVRTKERVSEGKAKDRFLTTRSDSPISPPSFLRSRSLAFSSLTRIHCSAPSCMAAAPSGEKSWERRRWRKEVSKSSSAFRLKLNLLPSAPVHHLHEVRKSKEELRQPILSPVEERRSSWGRIVAEARRGRTRRQRLLDCTCSFDRAKERTRRWSKTEEGRGTKLDPLEKTLRRRRAERQRDEGGTTKTRTGLVRPALDDLT